VRQNRRVIAKNWHSSKRATVISRKIGRKLTGSLMRGRNGVLIASGGERITKGKERLPVKTLRDAVKFLPEGRSKNQNYGRKLFEEKEDLVYNPPGIGWGEKKKKRR